MVLTIGEPPRRVKKWVLAKRRMWDNSCVGHLIPCGDGWLDARGQLCQWGDTPKMPTGLTHLFVELHATCCGKGKKPTAPAVGWPLLWVIQLLNGGKCDCQLLPNLQVTVQVWDDLKPPLLHNNLRILCLSRSHTERPEEVASGNGRTRRWGCGCGPAYAKHKLMCETLTSRRSSQ